MTKNTAQENVTVDSGSANKDNQPQSIHPDKSKLTQLVDDIINAEKKGKKAPYHNLRLNDENDFILLHEILKESTQLKKEPALYHSIAIHLQSATKKQPKNIQILFCELDKKYSSQTVNETTKKIVEKEGTLESVENKAAILKQEVNCTFKKANETNKSSQQLGFFKHIKPSTYLGVGATLFTLGSALTVGASLLKAGIIAATVLPPNPVTTPMAMTAIVLGAVLAAVGSAAMAFGLVKQSREKPGKESSDSLHHEEVNVSVPNGARTAAMSP